VICAKVPAPFLPGLCRKIYGTYAYACASRYASRYAGRYVVTLSVDQVTFRKPIFVGELVSFLASVNHTGTRSMEVGVKVLAQEIRTQAVRHVNSCFFTMVAVDDNRKPIAVPKLSPANTTEKRRYAAAELRKALRQEMRTRFQEMRPRGA
jgi:acyl-CoA hydrolase